MRYIWTICLFLLAANLRAQSVYSRFFNLQQGLPSNEVRQAYQDVRGFLWLCTAAGLVRYDGYEFEHYTRAQGLPVLGVRRVYEDQRGRLWVVGDGAHLSAMEGDKLSVHRLSEPLRRVAAGREVASVQLNAGDTMFVAFRALAHEKSDYAVYAAKLTDSVFQPVAQLAQHDGGALLYEVGRSALVVEAIAPFLVGGREGVGAAQYAGGRRVGEFLSTGLSDCHCHQQGGRLHCVNARYSVRIDLATGSVLGVDSFAQALPEVRHFYVDRHGNAWASTAAGAYLWEAGDMRAAASVYFAQHAVEQVLQDREGNYWLATERDGLIFMPYRGVRLQTVSPYAHQNRLLALLYLPPFVQALSSSGMVYRVTEQTVLPTYYNQEATPAAAWHLDSLRGHVLIGNGSAIEIATGNTAWAWWGVSGQAANLPPKIQARAFAPALGGAIWVAAQTGLLLLDQQTRSLLWQSKDIGFHAPVHAIAHLRGDTFLLATDAGLYKLCQTTKTLLSPSENSALPYRSGIAVRNISRSAAGQLLIATAGWGLWYEQKNGTWQQIQQSDGLSSDYVQKIYAPSAQTWWVATNKGLDKIVWRENGQSIARITGYSTQNGLPTNGIYDILQLPAAADSARLWLATDAGVVSFLPAQMEAESQANANASVHIRRLSVGGKEVAIGDSLIALPYGESNLQFEFLSIRFRSQGHIRYRYRLEGKDADWQTTTARSIQYTNLQHGDYTFWVAAENPDGSFSPQAATLRLRIEAPFWQLWWFQLSLVGAAVLVVWLAFALMRRRARLQKKVWFTEQNALHAQMNPHFIFNAMNSILYFVRQNDKRQATSFLASFSSLIRRILDNSKRPLIPLQDEIETLQRYLELERLRLSNPSDNFRIDIDSSVDPTQWQVPPMLIQPLIENSIMHGLLPKTEGERRLLVRIAVEKKRLRISVEDNGIGREAAAAIRARRNITHTSYGSRNIDERIRVLNQLYGQSISLSIEDLRDESGAATGTRVVVLIPPKLQLLS